MEQKNRATGDFPLNDDELIKLIRRVEKGNLSALMMLYDATGRLLFGLILNILGERASAEEALLDVYTHVWKQAAAYDPEMLPLEWLSELTRNTALAKLPWSKRDNGKKEIPRSAASEMTVAPEQQKTARSSLERIESAQRELLEWAYRSGLTCSEMAAQIGKPVGAVKNHLRLGLGTLGESIHPVSGSETGGKGGQIEARKSD